MAQNAQPPAPPDGYGATLVSEQGDGAGSPTACRCERLLFVQGRCDAMDKNQILHELHGGVSFRRVKGRPGTGRSENAGAPLVKGRFVIPVPNEAELNGLPACVADGELLRGLDEIPPGPRSARVGHACPVKQLLIEPDRMGICVSRKAVHSVVEHNEGTESGPDGIGRHAACRQLLCYIASDSGTHISGELRCVVTVENVRPHSGQALNNDLLEPRRAGGLGVEHQVIFRMQLIEQLDLAPAHGIVVDAQTSACGRRLAAAKACNQDNNPLAKRQRKTISFGSACSKPLVPCSRVSRKCPIRTREG